MSGFWTLCKFAGLVAAVAAFAGSGFAEPVSYGTLQKWEGYYPTKYANTLPLPAGKTFWDDPIVKTALAATLQPDQFKLLVTCWGTGCTEERIQLYDDMIAVHVCKKDSHDFRACQEWSAYIFVEMDSGRTSVCWNMMTPGDLEPAPASIWIWRTPGKSGDAGTSAIDTCTSASAFQHAVDQKNGKVIKLETKGLPGAKLQP
jgi:hypothetical protein